MLARSDEIDLLGALHEGVHEEPRWTTFLGHLRRRTRAADAALTIAMAGGAARPALRWSWQLRDEQRLADLSADERLPHARLRPGRVYGAAEIAELRAAPRQDARGEPHGRFVRVAARPDLDAWLEIISADRDFDAADGALLSSLLPHLAIAVRTLAELEAIRMRGALAETALVRAGIGWSSLDVSGRVIAIGGAELPDATPRKGWNEAVTMPMVDLPAGLIAAPASLALFRTAEPLRPAAAAALQARFGLSASEARLAIRLAAGDSLTAAAAALGHTVETARTYSKHLFAKTGTRGQADLVRLLLSGSVALA